jgi:epoxyqueuosine reductase
MEEVRENRPQLLLHTCCAPCMIYPVERLREQGFAVSALFYNPNIHPFAEYKKRKEAVEGMSARMQVETIYPEYEPEVFFRAVNMNENKNERCPICWEDRLRMTAQLACERGCTHFSTTLLVSPYQDQDMLKAIGEDIASRECVEFYYEDFRVGFRKAHTRAKAEGVYCQNYCGCLYSEVERCRKPPKR